MGFNNTVDTHYSHSTNMIYQWQYVLKAKLLNYGIFFKQSIYNSSVYSRLIKSFNQHPAVNVLKNVPKHGFIKYLINVIKCQVYTFEPFNKY